ncbi:uncharacterized protein LOC143284129 [Babylonia areolata]|uniref:uncharacterized protein LOC143284129 n=1 Tax=Babylonia areolata TaxID=304850 RepID=UPI003FCF875C
MRLQRFTRRKERQLWLMLLTIAMTTNLFLLLFLHSPWVLPGPLTFDYAQDDDPHGPADQPGPTRKVFRHPVPKPGDTAGEGFLQGAGLAAEDSASRELLGPQPRQAETMDGEPPRGAERLAPEQDKPAHEPLPRPHAQPVETMGDEPLDDAKLMALDWEDPSNEAAIVPDQKPVEEIGKEPPHAAKQMTPDKHDRVTRRPTLKPVERKAEKVKQGIQHVAEKNGEQASRGRELVPKLPPKQTVSKIADKKVFQRLPWLYNPKNMTRLQQVIQSLQVFSDEESLSTKQASYFDPRSSVVTSFEPEILIDSVRCPPRGPYLLVLIPSVDVNVRVRQAIRSTWASPAYGALWPHDARNITSLLKVVFIFGVKTQGKSAILEEESQTFQDIVQLDFQESYRNLSLKIALAVEWSTAFCPGAGHVMKVDEDTFVAVPLLLQVLRHLSDHAPPRFELGFHHFFPRPPVTRTGRWGVSTHLYPFPHFPRYLYGHSYVMSSGAVRELRAVWRYMPLIPNEDAFLTGVMAKVSGVTRIHCDWFAREDRLYPAPMPKEELAGGRSVSQSGFKPFQKLYNMWEKVKKVHDDV